MMKRIIALMLMLLVVPVLASAYNCWSVTKSVSPSMTATLAAIDGPDTTPAGVYPGYYLSGIKTYATAATAALCSDASAINAMQFNITGTSSYVVTKVVLDGNQASPLGTGPGLYTIPRGGLANRNLTVYFAPVTSYTITTTPAAGGSVTPSFQVQSGSNAVISVTPNAGYTLSGVEVDGVAQSSSVVSAVASSRLYTFTNVTANHSFKATFAAAPVVTAFISTPSGYANANESILVDGSLSASSVAGTTYAWSFSATAGSATLVPTSVNAKSATFTVTSEIPAVYTITLTVTAPTSPPIIKQAMVTYEVRSRVEEEVNSCISCHSIGNQALIDAYQASLHYAGLKASCSDCHNPYGTTTHPYTDKTEALNSCAGCHDGSPAPVPVHGLSDLNCVGCHDPHALVASGGLPAPHTNTITEGVYPASYYTSQADCDDCHVSGDATNAAKRAEWSASVHADTTAASWIQEDFKTLDVCVRCHTTTGFVNFVANGSTAAWGTADDKTKEVLNCAGCHADVQTGALRAAAPIKPYGNDYTNPNLDKSNICMDCHTGLKSGANIQALVDADFNINFNGMALIQPHGMAVGNTLFSQGYHFPGRSYATTENTHRGINVASSSGACISCHKDSGEHTFAAGATALCADCHGATLDTAQLTADRSTFEDVLQVLRSQLAAKGFAYSPTYPYFSNTNWGTGQAGANTMGAAFNYVLFLNEPAAYAHAPIYARQLVLDSIDWLDNEMMDDSVSALVDSMRGTSPELAASMDAYMEKDFCLLCHDGTAASARPMSSNAHDVHVAGSGYGPGSYLGNDVAACQACHNYTAGSHVDGSRNLLAGAGSACANCHAGTAPTWTATERLACTTCHAATPAILANGVAAPYKGRFVADGHGQFPLSNSCLNCHNPDSPHIDGIAGSDERLLSGLAGQGCAYCHNDPAKVPDPGKRNMPTHVGLACAACHDPHGTSNPAMLRTTINGQTIAIDNFATDLVQTTEPYLGFCQVCHIQDPQRGWLTNFFRAGVAENSHHTGDCLGCHSHTAEAGAFLPVGGTCDTCHGYPPAPDGLATYGTPGQWENAKPEDYLGGGGAHLLAQHVSPNAKASEGWANCVTCHTGGDSYVPQHKMTTPVSANIANVTIFIDVKYRFTELDPFYTGAQLVNPPEQNTTGNCFNVSCHMSPTPERWSKDR